MATTNWDRLGGHIIDALQNPDKKRRLDIDTLLDQFMKELDKAPECPRCNSRVSELTDEPVWHHSVEGQIVSSRVCQPCHIELLAAANHAAPVYTKRT